MDGEPAAGLTDEVGGGAAGNDPVDATPPWRALLSRARIASLRPVLTARVVVSGLVVAGIVTAVLVHNYNEDAPMTAVREYVDAIARGDATAANATVDPPKSVEGVDPALLTDQVLASAEERITVDKITAGTYLGRDVVEFEVTYSLTGIPSYAEMRVERAGHFAGVFEKWRVIDPLLAPVRIRTSEPGLDTVTIGGVTVPARGEGLEPPEKRLMYPGTYEVRGVQSRYLATEPGVIAVRHHSSTEGTESPSVTKVVVYEATPELTSVVTTRLADHVSACFAAFPDRPAGCPEGLYFGGDALRDIELVEQPQLESIQFSHVKQRADGSTEPPLRLLTRHGRFEYLLENGRRLSNIFFVRGQITVTSRDELTITFTSEF